MKIFRKLALTAVTAGLLSASMVSNASVISASDNPVNFSWSFDSQTAAGVLTGFGSMTVGGFGSSSLTVDVTLTNTAPILGQGGDRLTAFGFGINPNATSVGFSDTSDGGMIGAALGQTFPSLQTIEVCAFGGNNCPGGSNGGILAGNSDTFRVTLGGNWGDSVNIDPLGFKYQTGAGSFEFTNTTVDTHTVAEPGPTLGLALGLLAIGFSVRRRKKSSMV